jgi:hypothetical protein
LAVFITYEVLDLFIHMVVLRDTYQELQGLWRTNMIGTAWILFLTALVQSIIFVYFFTVGFESKGVREGIRYGFIFGLLMSFVGIFNQYAVYPVPLWLAWQWFAYGLIQFMVCGIVVALVFQPKIEGKSAEKSN